MPLPLYTFLTGLTSLSFFLTGFFVFSRNPHRPLYFRCFIFSLSVSLWALGYFLTLFAIPSDNFNFMASRLSHAFGAFIPITYLHFVWEILGQKPRKSFVLWCYILSGLMCLACLTPLVVKTLLPKMGIQYYPEWGTLYPLYAASFLIFPGYAQFEMGKRICHVQGTEKIRLIYFFVALGLAFSGGISLFLLIFNIPFPPFSSVLIILYPPMMAYTILVHRFLDIEVIIKRTLVFAGVSSFVIACFSVPLFLLPKLFANELSTQAQMLLLLVSGLAVAALVGPLNQFLVSITDKFLFQKKSEIKAILNRLSERVITIVDVEQIGKAILSTLEETLRLESGMLFLENKKTGSYRMLEHLGLSGAELTESIRTLIENTAIINYFAGRGRAILNLDQPEKKSDIPKVVLDWLNSSKFRVCIPLSINEDQFGVLILGKKKSDQEFTEEEMDFFPTIASQSALAIRNALLFEAVLNERASKLKAQDEAKRAHYAQTVAHEIKNKLVSINMPGHSLATLYVPDLKNIHERFYKGIAPGAVDKKYFQICDKLEHMGKELQSTASEIFVIAKTAQYDLEDDKEAIVTVSVNLIWQSAIRESGVKDLRFETEIPYDFKADANPTLFKAVLINFLTNAHDALAGQEDKRIEFKGRYEQVDSQQVAFFEFRDHGPGISKEIQNEIFLKGFSTKTKPVQMDYSSSGSGYGLYVCKETIESFHRGKLWVESESGKGTAFKFWLPFKSDASGERVSG